LFGRRLLLKSLFAKFILTIIGGGYYSLYGKLSMLFNSIYGRLKMKYAYAEYVPLLKAMSDETRLKIIDLLSCGELCACEILEFFNITQPTLSYHMKILVESGLVTAVRDGAWMRYTLNTEISNRVISFLAEITQEKEDCICKKCGKRESK